jgi:TonB family protein
MGYAMEAELNRSNWTGRVIDGRFTLLQWLGGSERSAVFLTDLQGDRSQKAAIKIIPADAVDAEAFIADWALTTDLSHPHLMRRFQTGRCEIDAVRQLYTVTEYAEENLSQILLERPLTPIEAREMLDPVLDVLSYLHRKGFVHGHLKPSNIMVVDDELKLSWDNLHVAGELGKHSSAPSLYDAPEGATGTISAAADIWSLGVILVEALTQHPPVWDRSTHREPVVPESIPQPFAGIVQESLRSDPERRCTLSDIKARLGPAHSVPVADTPSNTSKPVHSRLRVTALVAAVLVLFAVIAALQMRSRHVDPSLPTATKPVLTTPAPPPQSPVSPTPPSRRKAVKGAVAEQVLPDILPSARESIHGQFSLSIRVTVDPSGAVSTAAVDSPGPSKYFAKVALKAAQQWKFKPAQVDGQPVSSVWILRFLFTQTETEVTPIEESP